MSDLDRAQAAYAATVQAAKARVAGLLAEAEDELRALLPHAGAERSMLGEMRARLEVDRAKLVRPEASA